MAPDVNVRKPPAQVTFNCCKQKSQGSVCVCLLCDTLWHVSCAERKQFKSFGGVLGFCGACEEYITSNPAETSKTEVITVVNLKNKCSKLTKDNEELQNKLKSYRISHNEVKANLEERIKLHEREVDTMQILVSEMKDKNKLLEEKAEKLLDELNANRAVNNTPSYAEMAGSTFPKSYRKAPLATPVIVAAKAKQDENKVRSFIESVVKPKELNAQIVSLKEMNTGEVKIMCSSNEYAKKIMEKINSDLHESCDAKYEKLNLPKVKIVGIKTEYAKDELEENLKAQNFMDLADKVCNVTHIQKISKNNSVGAGTNKDADGKNASFTAYLEVDPAIFHKIMQTTRVFIGWQRCLVYEDLNLKRCYNCCGYGHSSKKCNNKQTCGFCAGEHDTKTCNQKDNLKCTNCAESNNKYKTKRSCNHSVFDHKKCDTYKSRESFLRTKINYTGFSQA